MVDYERIKYSITPNYELKPEHESALISQLKTLQASISKLGRLAGIAVLAKKFNESKTATIAGSRNMRADMVMNGIVLTDEDSRIDVSAAFDLVVRQTISVQEMVDLITRLTQLFNEKAGQFGREFTGRGR